MSFSYYGPLCTEVYNATKPVGHSLGGDIEFYRDYLKNCNSSYYVGTVWRSYV